MDAVRVGECVCVCVGDSVLDADFVRCVRENVRDGVGVEVGESSGAHSRAA